MSTAVFANGRWAWGICDRCGFQYRLHALRGEFVRGKALGNKVCPTCLDPDHPQNWQGVDPVSDPQALRDPRPDPSLEASRELTPLIDFSTIP